MFIPNIVLAFCAWDSNEYENAAYDDEWNDNPDSREFSAPPQSQSPASSAYEWYKKTRNCLVDVNNVLYKMANVNNYDEVAVVEKVKEELDNKKSEFIDNTNALMHGIHNALEKDLGLDYALNFDKNSRRLQEEIFGYINNIHDNIIGCIRSNNLRFDELHTIINHPLHRLHLDRFNSFMYGVHKELIGEYLLISEENFDDFKKLESSYIDRYTKEVSFIFEDALRTVEQVNSESSKTEALQKSVEEAARKLMDSVRMLREIINPYKNEATQTTSTPIATPTTSSNGPTSDSQNTGAPVSTTTPIAPIPNQDNTERTTSDVTSDTIKSGDATPAPKEKVKSEGAVDSETKDEITPRTASGAGKVEKANPSVSSTPTTRSTPDVISSRTTTPDVTTDATSGSDKTSETTPTGGSEATPTDDTTATPTVTPGSDVTSKVDATPGSDATPTPDGKPSTTPKVDATPTTNPGPEVTPTPDGKPSTTPKVDATPTTNPGSDATSTPEVTPGTTPKVDATPTTNPDSKVTPGSDATPGTTPKVDATPTTNSGPEVTPGSDATLEGDETDGPDVTPTITADSNQDGEAKPENKDDETPKSSGLPGVNLDVEGI